METGGALIGRFWCHVKTLGVLVRARPWVFTFWMSSAQRADAGVRCRFVVISQSFLLDSMLRLWPAVRARAF